MKKIASTLFILLAIVLRAPEASPQEQSPKGFVENLLEGVLAAEGRSLSVENVSISLTGDVTVGHVEVSDDTGPWLQLDDLSLVWKPLSLFADQLEIDDLSVGKVHMLRLSQSPEGSVAAPEQMQDLQAARIKRVAIGVLQIDAPVLGQAVEMKLEGSGEITAAPVLIRAELTASRLDGKKGDLKIAVDFDPKNQQFKTDLNLSEDADGVVATLLTLDGKPTVDLDLKAAGDLSTWNGDFGLSIDGDRVIKGQAQGAPGDSGRTITIEGTGAMAPLLPASLAQVFTGVSTLSGSAFLPEGGGAAEIDHLRIENDAMRFNLAGTADWTSTRTNLSAEILTKDPEVALTLPETGLLGQATVKGLHASLALNGALATPDWQVSAGWTTLTSDRLQSDDLKATLAGHGLLPGAQPVTFRGSVTTVLGAGGNSDMPPALLGNMSGVLSGTWNDGDLIALNAANVSVGAVKMAATGSLKPQAGSFDLTLSAATRSPQTGNGLVDQMLAGDVSIRGQVSSGQQTGIIIKAVDLSAPALSARLDGTVGPGAANLTFAAKLPDLKLIRSDVTGSIDAEATLAGPWDRLKATLTGRGENMTLLGKAFEQPSLNAALTLAGPSYDGQVSLDGSLDGKPVQLRATLATEDGGTLVLREVSARAGSASASGTLQWPPGGPPTGKLTFDAPDLSDVGPLLLTKLSGSLAGEIGMSETGATHATAIQFTGRNLAMGTNTVARAQGDVTIASLFDRPRPSGSISLASARFGGQRFDIVDVDAEAFSDTAFKVMASLKGRDLAADTVAEVSFAENGTTLSVSRLSGVMRGIAFKAGAPFTLRQRGAAVSVADAVLNIGNGRIKIDGQIAPRLDAKVAADAVPLSAFERLAGADGLSGVLSAQASLSGDLASPDGRFDLKVSGFSLGRLRDLAIAPIDGSAQGALKGGRLTLDATARSGNALSLTANGSISLSATGPINLSIQGRTNARLFGDRLADSGLRADGNIAFDVRLSGDTTRPTIIGSIDVSKGIIGDTAGQFTVRDVKGRIAITDQDLRIMSLDGATGRKGRASATGRVTFDGGVDLQAKVSNGTYTDGSLVTTRYDADLAVRGHVDTGIVVSGNVGLRGTKITLSELPRRAVSPLDVKHAHAPAAVKQQAAELRRRTSSSNAAVTLDISLQARDTVSVSGRGLNVVLNGGLNLRGPLGDLSAEGSFRLFRGQLTLPARSLDFERGTLTFDRNFDPLINFVAVSRRSDATITLTVSGRASEPEIIVTSTPELPPEEALARLIFDNSMLELSPLQVAQIASYVATLTGGGGSGLLSGLQSALGVDYLTVRENEAGQTEVGVAKRINDKLSVGVEQTLETNKTRVIIDLSATRNLKVRGSVDTEQSSRIGVYFEKDY